MEAIFGRGVEHVLQEAVERVGKRHVAEDMVELRFVDEMKKSRFVDKLYGRK